MSRLFRSVPELMILVHGMFQVCMGRDLGRCTLFGHGWVYTLLSALLSTQMMLVFHYLRPPPPPFRNIWTVIYIILSTPVPIAPAIVIIQRWHSAVSQNFSLFWSLWNRKNVPNQPVEGTRNYCHFSPASYVDLPESLSSTAAQKSTMGRCFRGFAQFVPRWFSYFWWPTPLQ